MSDVTDVNEQNGKRGIDWKYVVEVILATVCVLIPSAVKKWGSAPFAAIINAAGLHKAQIIITILIAGIGVGAYFFKQKNQRFYGIIEALFGAGAILAVAIGISPLAPTLGQWATMFGSAYVIARGLNNMAEAKKGVSKDRHASWNLLKPHA